MIDTSAFQGKKAAFFTLGCKLNFSETSTFGRLLSEMGVSTAGEGEVADICIINTCSVTEVADHKCRQAIHRMVRNHPGAFVVVTGCYAQLKPETVSQIEGVDLVLGANEKANLIQFLSEAWGGVKNGEALHRYHTQKTKDIKTLHRAARVVTVRVIFLRCRMAATISVHIAPFLMPVALAVIRVLRRLLSKLSRLRQKEARRLFSPA